MTLLELTDGLNVFVEAHPVESRMDINFTESKIVLENGVTINWCDEFEDEDYDDNFDECGFDPYCGCYTFDC